MGVSTPAPLNERPAMIAQTWSMHSPAATCERCEPLASGPRAGVVIAAGEFPIGHVVQQGRQLDDEQIGPFLAADPQGRTAALARCETSRGPSLRRRAAPSHGRRFFG